MNKITKALFVAGALFAANAQADVQFNGFASIVAGSTTSSDESLYGYDDSLDFKNG